MRIRLRRLLRRPKSTSKAEDTEVETTHDEHTLAMPRIPDLKFLELPIDLRSSPFSKATYSPPPSTILRLRQLQRAEDATTEPFRLMDLPVELRLNILAQHFGKKVVSAIFDGATGTARMRRFFFSPGPTKHTSAIMAACRQLHQEAQDVLYDSTTFIVRVVVDNSTTLRHKQEDLRGYNVCSPIPLRRMRNVDFYIDLRTTLQLGSPKDEAPSLVTFSRKAIFAHLFSELHQGRGLRTAEAHVEFSPFRTDSGLEWLLEYVFSLILQMKVDLLRKVSCITTEPVDDYGRVKCVPFNKGQYFSDVLQHFGACVDPQKLSRRSIADV